MRARAKLDGPHKAVVEALRGAGFRVQSLATIGSGCPDLLVGGRSKFFCLEVKDGSKPPSARLLTPDQKQWMHTFRDLPVFIVMSAAHALQLSQEIDPGEPCR